MKQNTALLITMAFSLIVMLPIAISPTPVYAQTTNYTIDRVDHNIQVLYSGHIIISDTIYVSGQVTNDFMIALPYQYSANILKTIAYDSNHTYQINPGMQLGDRSGFYAVQINFNGNTPKVFTVAFVLSNRLITEQSSTAFTLDFPAYPSFTQPVGTCNANLTFPTTPTTITINKDDGNINSQTYTKPNLPAYTYSIATANFQEPIGELQLSTISNLNRQVTIDPAGEVTVSDSYRITNNATSTMQSFIFSVPNNAANLVVKDDVGRALSTTKATSPYGNLMVTATLSTFILANQSTTLTVQYNLPSAKLQNGHYLLDDFPLFPELHYFVNHASIVFTPPEGATILTPKISSLDPSSILTREPYQDTLTITRDGISFLDLLTPQPNTIQISYDYNPVWSSFRPTIWAALLAVIGCVAVVFVRKRRPQEESIIPRTERLPTYKSSTSTATAEQPSHAEPKVAHHITPDEIREFLDAYEDRKRLSAELKSLDSRAQKGKIPRRQYKVQRKAVETRIEGLTRNIQQTKEQFASSGGTYPDIVEQLDAAEADLAEAEEGIANLEVRQSRGEIPLETYKRNIADYQKRRDKAESTISGIMVRLREKIR
ncbi:MAG: hypothetical protein NWE98_04680 [Candidatus Bathyarchaeota archaeon]|nr:hypothetical protein [Candidatus Bathyarchaeota archaeon]